MSLARRCGRLLVAAMAALQFTASFAAEPVRLFTGPKAGGQHAMGVDLARRLKEAGIDVSLVPTGGPADTLQALRDDAAGLRLALLQADSAYAYLAAAERGNPEAARWLEALRVIAPIGTEQLYFIVRRDSKLRSVHGIRGARINVGPLDGGTALAVTSLYRLMFDAPPAAASLSVLPHDQALAKLLTERSIDVVALMSASPARLLARMKPGARRFVRLLTFDSRQPGSDPAARVFDTATIRASDYPNLLTEDLPALASRSYLVARLGAGDSDEALERFQRAWCSIEPRLHEGGDKGISAGMPTLAPGWRRLDTQPCR